MEKCELGRTSRKTLKNRPSWEVFKAVNSTTELHFTNKSGIDQPTMFYVNSAVCLPYADELQFFNIIL